MTKKHPKSIPSDSPDSDWPVQCYVGSEIGELRTDGERPPRSARFVAELDLGSGPGGGDYRKYYLSTDRKRRFWILWLRADLDGVAHYCRVALGERDRPMTPKQAASLLLKESWKEEYRQGRLPTPVGIWELGLLDEADVRRIEAAALEEAFDG
jgi:hypothetical protein